MNTLKINLTIKKVHRYLSKIDINKNISSNWGNNLRIRIENFRLFFSYLLQGSALKIADLRILFFAIPDKKQI